MKKTWKLRRAGAGAIGVALLLGAMLSSLRPARAGEDSDESTRAKIRRGLEIAPVPLDLHGKDPRLVGLGSYIVNGQSSCNDCHSAGPVSQYAPGGNPFFGQVPAKENPKTYLGGGRDFGQLIPNTPNIVSRNLTPDKTGRPMGDSFQNFLQTIRTGKDPDHVHPTCTGAPNGTCLPAPFDGDRLQIMPWPVLQNMTDHDLLAIYEYLRAIPCVEDGPGELANRCH